jgi:hypothetical protein
LAATLVFLLVVAAPLEAQERDPFRLDLRTEDGGVTVAFDDLLSEPGIRSSMEAGLHVRLSVVTELWQDRWFDSQRGRYEWRATVRYDQLGGWYTVETPDGRVLQADTPADATSVLIEQLRVPLTPTSSGKFYYLGRLEMETLNLTDLEELRRWLRNLPPSDGRGDTGIGSTLGRGFSRLMVRLLDLPSRQLEARTPAFTWEP